MIQDVGLRWLLAIAMLALPAAAAQAAITIDMVAVGNAGNTADDTGYGAVDYDYSIGKYEVTAGQYRDFLNAVDPNGNNALGLYNPRMNIWSRGSKITLNSGASYGLKYDFSGRPSGTSESDWTSRPANFVSFWDAARFANWMHNGQGSGDTESGAYHDVGDQSLFGRNAGALYFIPTEDEWYKAAYYDPTLNSGSGGYYLYATMSDEVPAPSNVLEGGGNNATFYSSVWGYTIGSPYYRTEVGAHFNSASAYGTFDQGGNIIEWNEVPEGLSSRGVRGGSFASELFNLTSGARGYSYVYSDQQLIGFRLGSASSAAIPEPGSILVWLGLGLVGLIWFRGRQ